MVKESKIYLMLLVILALITIATSYNIKQLNEQYSRKLGDLEVKYEQISNKKVQCKEVSNKVMGKEKQYICEF